MKFMLPMCKEKAPQQRIRSRILCTGGYILLTYFAQKGIGILSISKAESSSSGRVLPLELTLSSIFFFPSLCSESSSAVSSLQALIASFAKSGRCSNSESSNSSSSSSSKPNLSSTSFKSCRTQITVGFPFALCTLSNPALSRCLMHSLTVVGDIFSLVAILLVLSHTIRSSASFPNALANPFRYPYRIASEFDNPSTNNALYGTDTNLSIS